MEPRETITCLNCDHEFAANFCPECGQSAETGRLSLRGLVRDFAVDTFNLDTGFLRTFTALWRNPGRACGEYVDGKRRDLSSPLRYALATLAITVLAYALTGYDPNAELAATNPTGPENEATKYFVRMATKYPSLSFFLPLPLVALLHRGMFRKSGRNYLEILVFNLFVTAHFNLLYLPIQLFAPLPFDVVNGGIFVALLPYFVWAARTFFGEPVWKISVKTLMMILLFVASIAGTVIYLFATGNVPTPPAQ